MNGLIQSLDMNVAPPLAWHTPRCCSRQLAVGTCEIVMLNRDSSVPRRTIARQTARCACRRGQIAGTTRARPACVDGLVCTLYTGGLCAFPCLSPCSHSNLLSDSLPLFFSAWPVVAMPPHHTVIA
ncbi:hypothetical protein PAMP_011692 [Pampus punctatissimus]